MANAKCQMPNAAGIIVLSYHHVLALGLVLMVKLENSLRGSALSSMGVCNGGRIQWKEREPPAKYGEANCEFRIANFVPCGFLEQMCKEANRSACLAHVRSTPSGLLTPYTLLPTPLTPYCTKYSVPSPINRSMLSNQEQRRLSQETGQCGRSKSRDQYFKLSSTVFCFLSGEILSQPGPLHL